GLVALMVEVDLRWERLKQIKAAGWKTPPGHPDLDPAHEARLLSEAYAEAARLPEVKNRPEEFRELLKDARVAAAKLELGLLTTTASPAVAETTFKSSAAACTRCHSKYRNVPAK